MPSFTSRLTRGFSNSMQLFNIKIGLVKSTVMSVMTQMAFHFHLFPCYLSAWLHLHALCFWAHQVNSPLDYIRFTGVWFKMYDEQSLPLGKCSLTMPAPKRLPLMVKVQKRSRSFLSCSIIIILTTSCKMTYGNSILSYTTFNLSN